MFFEGAYPNMNPPYVYYNGALHTFTGLAQQMGFNSLDGWSSLVIDAISGDGMEIAGHGISPTDQLTHQFLIQWSPKAVHDHYDVLPYKFNRVLAPGLLGNDIGWMDSAVLSSPPSNGTLSLFTNGGLTYTPTGNFVGTDSFTYRTQTAFGALSNTMVVYLHVGTVSKLALSASQVKVGQKYVTGQVTLTFRAASPVVVKLKSTRPTVAQVPATITIPAGKSGGPFTVTIVAKSPGVTTITATLSDESKVAPLTITN